MAATPLPPALRASGRSCRSIGDLRPLFGPGGSLVVVQTQYVPPYLLYYICYIVICYLFYVLCLKKDTHNTHTHICVCIYNMRTSA